MVNEQFQWKCHPEAEAFLTRILDLVVEKNTDVKTLYDLLLQKTSTRLFDWLDHIIISSAQHSKDQIEELGFVIESAAPSYQVFYHPGAQFPRLLVKDQGDEVGIAVQVESIANFLMVRGLCKEIEGSPFAKYRRALISCQNQAIFWVVERRAEWSMEPAYESDEACVNYLLAQQLWQTRPREHGQDEQKLHQALNIAQDMVQLVGKDLAAWIVLDVERQYWQQRNTAGQLQKNRQDRLGMGWANHDHHTFRSSRRLFPLLVRLFEILGFYCRERFYAGQEAGWGAQVMESPSTRLVLFLDVDLAPHEITIDFAHLPLEERKELGTIGLWCALHGDSILNSGMHHLEAQFMFEELGQDLSKIGISMMQPFSQFAYLKQAFTVGEIWPVPQTRLDELVQKGLLSAEKAQKFKDKGALGSHLENLQRREGYKGFNQKNVSFIIAKTDPRHDAH